MRILHTSDWHLGRTLEGISRLNEQADFIDFICRMVDEERIDLVIIAGDIYDTYNPPAAAENLFYKALAGLNDNGARAVIVIAGNHDNPERLCAAAPLLSKSGIILLGRPSSKAEVSSYNRDNGVNDDKRDKSSISDNSSNGDKSNNGSNGDKSDNGDNGDKSSNGDNGDKSDNSGNNDININSYIGKRINSIENYNHKHNNSGVKIVRSDSGFVELFLRSCGQGAVILTLPYPSESRLLELLNDEADERDLRKAYSQKIGTIFNNLAGHCRKDTVNLATGHFFVLGGHVSDSERTLQVGGALSVDPADLPEGVQYLALGHLHRPQRVKTAKCHTYYSGSPLAYSFSESNHAKAVYIVDVDPGAEPTVNAVYVACGKPLRKWVAERGPEQAVEWCKAGKDHGCWVDIEIHSDRVLLNEEYRRLRELHDGIVSIRVKTPESMSESEDYADREGMKIEDLFSDFYKFRTGEEIDEGMMSAFLEVVNTDPEVEEHEA
ncbi:MAG: exonuclease SbcCD subunit D C-terminal domain-containing protein [Oscillospiraceae bacterium]|nr:exonuclease SbcCD subunit D C-terminal domain-containing protein [Oscillospiraceae bacterium]